MPRNLLATIMLMIATNVLAFPYPTSHTKPKYEAQVVVNGVVVREYFHNGKFYVMGTQGDRYAIRVKNNTGRRVEVVVTVDGLDVIDGKPGSFSKRGYVLQPYQTYDIEGFRVSMDKVAAFRFSSVGESYAAKTGNARNVGVIGVAFFEERYVPPPQPIVTRDDQTRYPRKELKSESEYPAPSAAGVGKMTQESSPSARPGLGTEFGEARNSRVRETTFVRADPKNPTMVLTIYYNDRDGLIAMGVPVDAPLPDENYLRDTANPFPANPNREFARPPEGWQP